MKKEATILGNAMMINVIQLIACFSVYFLLPRTEAVDVLYIIVMVVMIAIWILFGWRIGISRQAKGIPTLLSYSILSIMPILVCVVLSHLVSTDAISLLTKEWTEFYFLGAPLVFWFSPYRAIISVLNTQIYMSFYIVIIILFVCSILGAFIAFNVKKASMEKVNRRTKPLVQRSEKINNQAMRQNPQDVIHNTDK